MIAYIQAREDGIPHNYNMMNAYQGFREMGFEIRTFYDNSVFRESKREDVIVGCVDTVRSRLHDFGIAVPEIDYPDELRKYLGRKIRKTKMSEINNDPDKWPVFIKPLEDKQFTGVVVRSTRDLIGCGIAGVDQEIYCSEVVDLVSEWRCFVRYGRILDVRHYAGDWRKHFDHTVIENAVNDYTTAPAAYSADFGLTSDGRTLLIEINDGYALGCYGLFYIDYAKLLSARWAELTGTEDECAFDLRRM